MKRVLDIRILSWHIKLLCVIGAITVGFLLGWVLAVIGTPEPVRLLLLVAIDLGLYFLCSRIFRVAGEDLVSPRAWWRMTGRVRLSRVLGILFALLALGSISTTVTSVVSPSASDSDPAVYVFTAFEHGTLAFLYLNSAIRLRRIGDPPRPPKVTTPKFTPMK